MLHVLGDGVPHRDIANQQFELGSGLAGVLLLAVSRGPTHPVTLGGLSAAAPDLEHLFPALRPRGAKLFHGKRGWHRSGRLSAHLQLVVAATILGFLAARGDSR
jgi:hypothetical protein